MLKELSKIKISKKIFNNHKKDIDQFKKSFKDYEIKFDKIILLYYNMF